MKSMVFLFAVDSALPVRSRGLRTLTLLLCLTLFGGFGSAGGAEQEVLRLANGEWPPHTGRDLPGQGCDSRVAAEAFALEGIRVEYAFLPWARGLLHSQNGLLDGAIEWAGTEEQRKTHFVSRAPLSLQHWVFFHRRDRTMPREPWHTLTGVTVGLTIGYAYSDVFAELRRTRPALFSEASSDLLNFRKLLAGRIDLFPIERSVGWHLLNSRFSPEERSALVQEPAPLAEFTPRLLLSRAVAGNEERMRLFDRGLERLKASGRHRELIAPCTHGMQRQAYGR